MKALCLDFGNTFCKIAIIDADKSMVVYKYKKQEMFEQLQQIQESFCATHSIYCSVLNDLNNVTQYLQQHTHFLELSTNTKLPFANLYNTPHTLGKDRLALVAQAANQFPDQHCLVISCGSCITYNFINNKKEFIGGSISPGVQMRYKAMHQFTEQLPEIKNLEPTNLIGTDTNKSLQSGVMNGICAEIDGIIGQYEKLYPKINVVLTGGDMPKLALGVKSKIFADANFLFKGLYTILQFSFS
jgi:type III pantothenate kinase